MDISKIFKNNDGSYLRAFELKNIPFEVKRVFLISSSDNDQCKRGSHAHYKGLQVLACIQGEIKICYENKDSKGALVLRPGDSFYHKNLEWLELNFNKKSSMLISFCSEDYDEKDYIREYTIFKKMLEKYR